MAMPGMRGGMEGFPDNDGEGRRMRSIFADMGLAALLLAAAGNARADTVAVVGDSIAVGLTAPLAEALAKAGDRVDGYAVSGSGLANPKLADWPAKAKRIAEGLPTAVVVQIGTNDGQGMGRALPFGTDAWKAEYRRRADALLAPFAEAGTEIRCLGTLPPERPDLKRTVPVVSEILREACVAAGGSYVDVEVRPQDRAGDLVHLTLDGYARLGEAAARAVHTPGS